MEIHTSAGCFLIRKSQNQSFELLIIHRKWVDGKEAYVVPKGHVENGESIEEAALRETTEETGYTNIQIVKSIGSRKYNLNIKGGIEKTDHFFLALLKSEEWKKQTLTHGESETGFEVQWKSLDEAFKLLTWENNQEFLLLIKDYLKNL